jgi:hypothetical protein
MGPPNFKYDIFITGVNLKLLNFLMVFVDLSQQLFTITHSGGGCMAIQISRQIKSRRGQFWANF